MRRKKEVEEKEKEQRAPSGGRTHDHFVRGPALDLCATILGLSFYFNSPARKARILFLKSSKRKKKRFCFSISDITNGQNGEPAFYFLMRSHLRVGLCRCLRIGNFWQQLVLTFKYLGRSRNFNHLVILKKERKKLPQLCLSVSI